MLRYIPPNSERLHDLSEFGDFHFQGTTQVILAIHVEFLSDVASLTGDIGFRLVQPLTDVLETIAFEHQLADFLLTLCQIGAYHIPSQLFHLSRSVA